MPASRERLSTTEQRAEPPTPLPSPQIRLYSEKTLTQAKTAIPGMGLPITSVDVTFDGTWGDPGCQG